VAGRGRTPAIITSHTGYKVYKPTPAGWLAVATLEVLERASAERDAAEEEAAAAVAGTGIGLANVVGGRNVRIITGTPWNPARWHHGDGKRGRQIRTIAGVSRTALSVMVVVLSLFPPPPPPACLVHPFTLTAGCARALTRSHRLARLDLAGSPVPPSPFTSRNIQTLPPPRPRRGGDPHRANFETPFKYPSVHVSSILATRRLVLPRAHDIPSCQQSCSYECNCARVTAFRKVYRFGIEFSDWIIEHSARRDVSSIVSAAFNRRCRRLGYSLDPQFSSPRRFPHSKIPRCLLLKF